METQCFPFMLPYHNIMDTKIPEILTLIIRYEIIGAIIRPSFIGASYKGTEESKTLRINSFLPSFNYINVV